MPDGYPEQAVYEEEAFWEWASKTYSPEEVEILRRYTDIRGSAYWAYFVENVYTGFPRMPVERLPRGRPTPEKYGINETDWQVLMMVSGNPAKVQRELETWLSTGYINQYQARDIGDELNVRLRQAQLELFYPETAPELKAKARKEEIARLKETGEVGITGIPRWQLETWEDRVKAGEITSEEVTRYIEKREALQEKRVAKQRLATAWRYEPPEPEYGRAFEEERLGLGGAQPWRSWFESQYPTLVSRFKLTIPKMEQRYWEYGLRPREVEARVEKTWAEYLKKRKPELREEYATRYPFGVGGRPWAFAPRIQTVKF